MPAQTCPLKKGFDCDEDKCQWWKAEEKKCIIFLFFEKLNNILHMKIVDDLLK